MNNDIALNVEDLKVWFYGDSGVVRAVDGVSFSVKRGSCLAIVGESGCGKTVTAYSILKLIREPGRIVGGKVTVCSNRFGEIDVTSLSKRSEMLYKVRGSVVSMVFQEPMSALSPVHTVGNQICEAMLIHQKLSKERARERAAELLAKVGIPEPTQKLSMYPHELSGGMRQRVVIAMALASNPEILIADEPTTAIDLTVQAQILALIKQLQASMGLTIVLITHDFGVVAQCADEVAVMYLGRIVEKGSVGDVIKSAGHPYTKGLLESLPELSGRRRRLKSIKGSVPSLGEIPQGCPFHPRCGDAKNGMCDVNPAPVLENAASGHWIACHRKEAKPQK